MELLCIYALSKGLGGMLSAIQYCFWVEGSFTFLSFVWGFYYFWSHPEKPVWGGLRASGLGWCASLRGFALITLEFWDCSEWHVVALYSAFLIGEAAWMFLTAWQWNRFCLLTMSGAAGLLAVEAFAHNPSSIAVAPAALLAAHVGLWDAVFWMRTWEAEVLALY